MQRSLVVTKTQVSLTLDRILGTDFAEAVREVLVSARLLKFDLPDEEILRQVFQGKFLTLETQRKIITFLVTDVEIIPTGDQNDVPVLTLTVEERGLINPILLAIRRFLWIPRTVYEPITPTEQLVVALKPGQNPYFVRDNDENLLAQVVSLR